ncbi:MAG: hypothetical protein EU542_06400 [Promethearchaeota archaeon]|nr:MAG: hypothetical protein EU542_06400 [Candidatus Lokiarchaeota archaeon]
MELKDKIKQELLSKGTKLRNKYPPISERKNGTLIVQKVKSIFQLNVNFRNYYLLITKSTNKRKDLKYYLTLIIASQSSDLLAKIAKKVIGDQKKIRLIQFPFHPEHFRVNLALLRELDEFTDFTQLMTRLNSLRTQFRTKLHNIIN